jgi:GNAT superfamily N-acetyltransferase
MPPTEEIIQVCMKLASLDAVARHPLPPGFSFRMYRSGDEKTWTDIWQRADVFGIKFTPQTFGQEFPGEAQTLAQRQFYLLDPGGTPIGTAAAWFPDDAHGKDCGCIHWVAIVPEMQGRGLSRPLLAATLERMKALGYRSSYLRTQTVRVAAIKLYMEFGFVPEITKEKEREGWLALRKQISPSRLDAAAI